MKANHFSLRHMAAALALALCSSFAAADTTVAITIDTSSFGAGGWLDLQFNPAYAGAPAATATVSNFAGFDAAAAVETAGQVTGSLAAGYVFGNGDSWNDLFHSVTYGGILSFNVTFGGDADLSGNIGESAFAVSAYAADGLTLLGASSSVDGSLAVVNWTPATVAGAAGSIATAVYSDAVSVSAVPEPSSWLMLGIGGMLIAGVARRKAAKLG